MGKILRQPWVDVQFNQAMFITTSTGVTITVHGQEQNILQVSGSGTGLLRFRVQRAIFRHVVTFAYDGLGDIQNASGDPLGAIPETEVSNNLPDFTLWDWSAVAPSPETTDTLWDTDTSRYDEVVT